MIRRTILVLWACALFGPAYRAMGGEISIVPVGASGTHVINGNQIILTGAGQRVELEIFISDWDPDLDGTPSLKAWEVDIDPLSYTSGAAGQVAPPLLPCTTQADPNHYCRSIFGGICTISGTTCLDSSDCAFDPVEQCQGSTCGTPTLVPQFCDPAFIQRGRSDFIFKLISDLTAVDLSGPIYRYASASQDDSVADPGVAKYAGTLILDASADARGTFEIWPLTDPTKTVLVDSDNLYILPLNITPAEIVISCTSAADCDDGDGCTLDICQPNGTCRYRPSYDTATQCCSSPSGSLCSRASGQLGDADLSGTVDLADVAAFQTCIDELPVSSFCAPLDLDCNCGVTLGDYPDFNALIEGP